MVQYLKIEKRITCIAIGQQKHHKAIREGTASTNYSRHQSRVDRLPSSLIDQSRSS